MTPITLLIGLAGPARAGKSTAQAIIADRFGLARINFADPLKDALTAMLGVDFHQLDGTEKEAPLAGIDISPRELMQTLGTEWARVHCGPDFWVKVARRRLAMLEDIQGETFQGAVFSDVRFNQEADFIRQHGGTVIHLRRLEAPRVRGHASEAGIAVHPSDVFIANHGDLDELNARLSLAVDHLIDAGGARPCFA